MSLLSVASVPAATVGPDGPVIEAVRLMDQNRVGAVAVVKEGQLFGIFTERDLMTRVVLEGRDPKTTAVSEVMTREVEAVDNELSYGDALRIMVERHFRHLPVVDSERRVLGMLSIRDLLQQRVEDLSNQLDSMVNYFSADGIGG